MATKQLNIDLCKLHQLLVQNQELRTHQFVRDKDEARMFVTVRFFGNETEKSLLSFVIRAVRYPEEEDG